MILKSDTKRKYKNIFKYYELYLFILPMLLYFAVLHYWPMYGVLIAFKNFKPHLGILKSEWVGFYYFIRFFKSPVFWRLIRNTLGLSLYSLVGFPVPIILAIGLNYLRSNSYKRFIQTVTYAPHFISTVVIVGMLNLFLSPTSGIVNMLLQHIGIEPIFFMGKPKLFSSIYVWSGIWQNMGWSSIIYLAALSAINPSLHEAAIVDGAGKIRRIIHIDLPGIAPTIMILLILRMGKVMSIGFEKVFLMQNALNMANSEIISTYVYQKGLVGGQYSYSTAVGLFNSAINMILLLSVNSFVKRTGQNSLW